jgi:nitroreductase
MPDLTPAFIRERLSWRYACKRFDPARKVSAETWDAIEQSLVLTPSSFGLQPWRFVVITAQELKDRLPPISWHQTQPRECSHMVVLAARRSLDEAYVDHFVDSVAETRSIARETLAGYRNVMVKSVQRPEQELLDWNTRQVYIALGQLMTAAAMLGVDTCPMEGIDAHAYDLLLGLAESAYTTVLACAVGYRHPEDKYATLPKVRFSTAEMVQRFE